MPYMDATYSITDVRARLPELIRDMSDSGDDIGITQQGRLTAVLTRPDSDRKSPTAWLYLGALPADHCQARVCTAHEPWTLVAPIHLWVHVASGAIVSLGPSADWRESGYPVAYYHPGDSSQSLPIASLPVPESWPGGDSTKYGDIVHDAVKRVTRLLDNTR